MKDIKEFGVLGNGKTEETVLIQHAIDICASNGEKLVFSAGTYKVGTLFLKDNSHITIDKNALISGIPNISAYMDNDAMFVDGVNVPRGKALIVAHKASNISVCGNGTITGNSSAFDKSEKQRPFLIRMIECTDVKVEDVTLKYAVSWCFHLDRCTNVLLNNLCIRNRGCSNNDGIDIDSCQKVSIVSCDVSSGDDAICLKTTSDMPCSDIHVENCQISSDCGGFKIGTESVGDFKDIVVENCKFLNVKAGSIKITPTDGGIVENVTIKNVVMENCTGPIFIAAGTRNRVYAGGSRKTPSRITNVNIYDIKADVIKAPSRGKYDVRIDGWKESDGEEKRLSLYDYGDWCEALGGIILSGTKNEKLRNISIQNADISLPGGFTDKTWEFNVREMGSLYPEFHRFDPVPSKGIFIRHACGVELRNINLTYKSEDIREEIICEDSDCIKIDSKEEKLE